MKATDMLNKVKEVLGVELSEAPVEVKLAQAELENGAIIESDFEIGSEVFIVTEDEKVALPVGEYKLIDGETLVVEEEGIIASIGAVEEAPEEEEVEAEKEEMNYATKEELQEVKEMVEEIKAILLPKKEEEMAEEPVGENSVKSEETTTKTVYAEKEELSEPVQKVTHNPEKENKPNLNLYSQKRGNTTLDRVLNKISNFK
tara:strand:- start:104 stop:709 length:606 start_codon:yes stop_codon:yes gene_type:complete